MCIITKFKAIIWQKAVTQLLTYYSLLTNKQYMLIKPLVVASPQKVVLTQGDAIIFTMF